MCTKLWYECTEIKRITTCCNTPFFFLFPIWHVFLYHRNKRDGKERPNPRSFIIIKFDLLFPKLISNGLGSIWHTANIGDLLPQKIFPIVQHFTTCLMGESVWAKLPLQMRRMFSLLIWSFCHSKKAPHHTPVSKHAGVVSKRLLLFLVNT